LLEKYSIKWRGAIMKSKAGVFRLLLTMAKKKKKRCGMKRPEEGGGEGARAQ